MELSWGGIWAGFLVGLGVLMLLNALGLAIGISLIDINRGATDDAQAWGIGAAAWLLLSLLASLFIAGMVSSRAGAVIDPRTGALQGTVVWVLAMLALMLFGALGMTLGSNALVGRGPGVGPAVSRAVPDLAADIASGDVNQVIARLGDPATANRIASATGLPRDEVQARLGEIRGRMEAYRTDPARALAEAREGLRGLTLEAGAKAARPYATATGWATFGILVLSLGAAVLGGRSGASGPVVA